MATISPEDAGEVRPHGDTRQRILDVALDLFIEQGYDKTSLRQIADRLGLTKAALYYHFPSKLEILKELHYQLHHVIDRGVDTLERLESSPEQWVELFDHLIDELLVSRKHLLLHERNQAAFDELHRQGHQRDQNDLEERMRRIVTSPKISLEDKVRLSCAQGALISGVMLTADESFGGSTAEIAALLKATIRDTLGHHRG